MHLDDKNQLISDLEVIMAKVDEARRVDEHELLVEAQQMLVDLRDALGRGGEDPLASFVRAYRTCTQDIDRAELLYSCGYDPSVVSAALGVSQRRIYQLLRLARLPSEVKTDIRKRGLTERQVRPLLKGFGRGL